MFSRPTGLKPRCGCAVGGCGDFSFCSKGSWKNRRAYYRLLVSIYASEDQRVETNRCKGLVNLGGRNAVIDQFDKSMLLRRRDELATESFSLRGIMETREVQRGKHNFCVRGRWFLDG